MGLQFMGLGLPRLGFGLGLRAAEAKVQDLGFRVFRVFRV